MTAQTRPSAAVRDTSDVHVHHRQGAVGRSDIGPRSARTAPPGHRGEQEPRPPPLLPAHHRRTDVWGRRDNTATFRNAIGARFDRNEHIFGLLGASFAATFPRLAQVRFTHASRAMADRPHTRLPAPVRQHLAAGPSRLRLLRPPACALVPGRGEAPRTWSRGRTPAGSPRCSSSEAARRCPRETVRYVGAQLTRKEGALLWYDEGGDAGRVWTRATGLFAWPRRSSEGDQRAGRRLLDVGGVPGPEWDFSHTSEIL